jgi:hypothetical protein|tara:strand:+ start:510 stop:728 length:219 start_codon:yes stop_codon:yes gene_type:complete
MGKVKQAIQEVEEEIISLVEDGFKLNEIKTTFNYRKAMNDLNNPYFLDDKLVTKYYDKAVWEKENGEEYPYE